MYNSPRPKDIHFREDISNTRGDLLLQQQYKPLRSKYILLCVHISNTRDDHYRQPPEVGLLSPEVLRISASFSRN